MPSGSALPLAPYSLGIESDNIAYVSGTLPIDTNGNTVGGGDASVQARHALESIKSAVRTKTD